jgi:hypothetical protein
MTLHSSSVNMGSLASVKYGIVTLALERVILVVFIVLAAALAAIECTVMLRFYTLIAAHSVWERGEVMIAIATTVALIARR